ncbi:MAG: hypothetical protein WDO18_11140 [Acidobacteriota bacterium]
MRPLSFLATALFAPLLLTAQTFPPNADLNKTISILQSDMRIEAISVDATGNVYLAGSSDSAFTAATTKLGPRGDRDLFVIKMNPTVDQVIYATAIGGASAEFLRALRVDATGSVYLLGSTQSVDMPFTKTTNPTFPVGAFVVKLNPAGTAATYAYQLGSRLNAMAFDLDSTGAVYVAGAANSNDLFATAGALKQAPAGGASGVYAGVVIKINTAGNNFDAVTYYGDVDKLVDAVNVRSNGVLIQYSGNMVLLNSGLTAQTSSTPIGLTSTNVTFDSTGNSYWAGTNAGGVFAVRKFSPSGQILLDKTYTNAFNSNGTRIAVANNGRIFLFGQSAGANFATKNATSPCLANVAAPNGTAGLALNGDVFDGGQQFGHPPGSRINNSRPQRQRATFHFHGPDGRFGDDVPVKTDTSTWPVTRPSLRPPSSVLGAASCASIRTRFRLTRRLSAAWFTAPTSPPVPATPGTFLTFFGTGIGPTPAVPLTTLDANGRVGPLLGGVGVTVDGKPAPMVYSSTGQINFITPWNIKTDGSAVPACLIYQSTTTCIQVSTAVARPGAFICDFSATIACALNEDNSLVTAANPVPPGKVAQLFMTGFGTVEGTLVDGGVATGALRHLTGP